MAKLNLQKHGTDINYATQNSQNSFGPISVIPGTGLFLGINWISTTMVKPGNSDHPASCTFLANPPYYHADTFRYPDINIRMWYSDWFYSIS